MLLLKTKRTPSSFTALLVLFILSLTPAVAVAGSILTFETRPDGTTPIDDEIIGLGVGYTTDNGVTVTFGFDTNNDGVADLPAAYEDTVDKPAFGASAEPEFGYCTSNYGNYPCSTDQAAPGYETQLGSYFIRASGAQTDWDSFIILYDATNPVTAATGEIWDIDRGNQGWEKFHVSVYDESGALLAAETSPQGKFEHNPEGLDAKPWVWTFSGLSNINKIVFTRDTEPGTKPYFPLGFNNFAPDSPAVFVPEPSSSLLLLIGACCWGAASRRRR